MADVEKLTAYIDAEATAEAKAIIDNAKAEAEELLKSAKERISQETDSSRADVDSKEKIKYDRIASQCAQEEKMILLRKKQEIIDMVLKRAQERIEELPANEYFDILLKLLAKSLEKGEAEMLLSEKDLQRMPSDFETKASRLAAENGGALSISRKPANISGGFILRYGFIEINSSLQAIFEDNREVLQDEVNSILWK